jgi:hypothetical protein
VTEIKAFQARRTAERPSGPAYWLITKNAHGRIEVLTLDCRQTLPVFSHKEEAEMFLRLGGMDDGWRVSESRVGELVSVLYGPCAGVEEVALDPLPEMVAERIVGLVSQARECFIERILARRLRGLWERRQRSGVGLISTPRPT